MADFTYATVAASAGFAGESFDVCSGYNVSYTTAAGDAVFATGATNTITLTAGTWPTWIREVGKVFSITGTTSNNADFTTVSIDITNKILTVKETIINESPAGAVTADGSADTALIDVLLKTGNGALTTDAPLVLVSTGALGAARTLDISALEVEDTAQGAQALRGRIFIFGVLNSDISQTNSITLSATTSINGAPTFAITSQGDYMFAHVANGVWRCTVLPRPADNLASVVRIPFTAADWSAGTINQITIPATGALSPGQVGPHGLAAYGSYLVQVINTDLTPDEMVDVETQFNAVTGAITLLKAQKAKPFNGVCVIAGSLD